MNLITKQRYASVTGLNSLTLLNAPERSYKCLNCLERERRTHFGQEKRMQNTSISSSKYWTFEVKILDFWNQNTSILAPKYQTFLRAYYFFCIRGSKYPRKSPLIFG